MLWSTRKRGAKNTFESIPHGSASTDIGRSRGGVAEPGTQNIRTPPEIQWDVGRMRWAINEAAGIKQRFGSIRPSQKRNTKPKGKKKTPVLGRCLSTHF